MNILRNLFDDGDHPLKGNPFRIKYPAYGSAPDASQKPEPVHKKVLMITHNPILRTKKGLSVKEYFNWNDPEKLAEAYIEDVRWASYDYANYEPVGDLVEITGSYDGHLEALEGKSLSRNKFTKK